MAELNFESINRDKMKLYGRDWSVTNPKAVILLIPGFGDYCDRYKYLKDYFNANKVAVVGIDLRGQGRSGGERGYTPDVDALLDDVTSGINIARERYPNTPLFVHGDGIGAAIAILYTVQLYEDPLRYDGLIACTPSVAFPKDPSGFQLALVRAFAFLAPHFRAPVLGGDYEYTDNPEVIEARKTDSIYHDRWTAKTTAILCDAALYLQSIRCHFSVPTLLQHGTKAFLPMEKVRDWKNRCTGDVTLQEWEGLHAELHNDLGRNQVFDFTLKWMEEKIEKLNNKSS